MFNGKTLLITGGTGSFGNAILNRFLTTGIGEIRIFSRDEKKQDEMFEFLDKLEYGLLNLPRPDMVLFLHMPNAAAKILKQNRTNEAPDQHELDEEYQQHSEKTYLRLAEKRGFIKISCVENERIKTINEINEEVVEKVVEYLNLK